MTLDDAMALAMDETWVTAPDWIAGLDWALRARPERAAAASAEFRAAVERLRAFDGRAAARASRSVSRLWVATAMAVQASQPMASRAAWGSSRR